MRLAFALGTLFACALPLSAGEFSVGFGRSIASWIDRHGTQWRISWLPLGGYVKMHGQERPEEPDWDCVARRDSSSAGGY